LIRLADQLEVRAVEKRTGDPILN